MTYLLSVGSRDIAYINSQLTAIKVARRLSVNNALVTLTCKGRAIFKHEDK